MKTYQGSDASIRELTSALHEGDKELSGFRDTLLDAGYVIEPGKDFDTDENGTVDDNISLTWTQ